MIGGNRGSDRRSVFADRSPPHRQGAGAGDEARWVGAGAGAGDGLGDGGRVGARISRHYNSAPTLANLGPILVGIALNVFGRNRT